MIRFNTVGQLNLFLGKKEFKSESYYRANMEFTKAITLGI
jgi:hypothetical protein